MILTQNLTKIYRRCSGILRRDCKEVKALDDMSFKIKKGEIVGIIGPNGSGKSTLTKLLTGIMVPTSGEAKVADIVPWENREKLARKIGVIFGGKSALLPYVPVYDNLLYLAHLYGVSESRIEKLAKEFEIDNLEAIPLRLSLGQRMKAELVATLIHDPEIIFLDEPTLGLDIVAKRTLVNKLKELGKKGKTIIFISHDLNEVEELCSRVIIMNKGKKIFDGNIADLRGIVDYKVCRITTEKPVAGRYVTTFRLKKGTGIEDVIKIFASYGIRDVEIFSPPIEDVVERFYR